MTDEPSTPATVAHDLLAAVQPLLLQVRARRSLSPGKLGILRHVLAVGRATTSELAAQIHVSPQGISLAAHELEGLGLIERIPDTVDRRRIWIVPTDAGRDTFAQERASGDAWLSQVISERLTPADLALVEAALPALRKITSEVQHG